MIEQLTVNVIKISAFTVNCYLLVCQNELVLIDAGLPQMVTDIKKAVAAYSLPNRRLTTILITHADPDHYGAVAALQNEYGSRLVVRATSPEIDAIENGTSSRELHPRGFEKVFYAASGLIMKVSGASVTSALREHEVLPYLGGLEVLPTPGHTPGHVSFYLPGQKILFCGDSIKTTNRNPVPSNGANTWDEATAKRSFQDQIALNPALICGGHCLRKF